MELDLQAIRKELADTQTQFNSTREVLELVCKEKQDLLTQLHITSARLNSFENNRLSQDNRLSGPSTFDKRTNAETIDH